MFEGSYKASTVKILKESLAIWIYVLTFIIIEIYGIQKTIETEKYAVIVIINIFWGALVFFSIRIFLNYLKYTSGKNFIINDTSLKLIDDKTNLVTEINLSDIVSFEFYSCKSFRPPWSSFEHVYFRGIDDKKIIVTSFMMDVTDLRKKEPYTSIIKIEPELDSMVYPLIR